ncbi:MAG: hypothetical protein ABEJ69_02875 [Candidatus Nanohaloarchaea archaeon]
MSSETSQQTISETVQNPDTHDWSSPPYLTGRREASRLDGYGELYIENVDDFLDASYRVKYRKGRFGPAELPYNEFDDLEDAHEYAALILSGRVDLEELRVFV